MKTPLMSAAGLIIMLTTTSGLCRGESGAVEGRETAEKRSEHFGIKIESSYIGEFWTNARGGYKKEQTHLHNIGVAATVDTKQVGLWNAGKFFVHVLSDQGGMLLTEEIVGDSQTVSNIEAPHSTRLYELWYEQILFDGKVSFLLGIHDLNSEFAASEHSSFFINSSFGISKEISGGARPSIFPLAAPAMRAKYTPDKSWEFMLGIYKGIREILVCTNISRS
jgi:porin